MGADHHAGVPRQGPGASHAHARGGGAAARVVVGELRDHAVPVQQARPRASSIRPTRASGRWSTAPCATCSATLYPLLARATYPTLGFPQYAGEVGTSDGRRGDEGDGGEDAQAALAEPIEVYRAFFLGGVRSSAATNPRSRTSACRPRSSSCGPWTTPFRTGAASTWLGSSRLSATLTRSRPPTSAATSSTSSRSRRLPV